MRSQLHRLCLAAAFAAPISAGSQARPDVNLMFRGTPAHTGVANGPLFNGQPGVKWRFQTRGPVRSSAAVTASRVFIGSGDSTLYALDRATGKLVWKFAAGSPVHASPAVARGLVIAATLGGRIFAVSEATGALQWSIQTGPTLAANITPAGAWDFYVSSPVITGTTVFIGAGDGNVYSLDLTSGKERWRAKTTGKVRATPSVHDGVVVVGSWDGRVYALDAATGKERWVHRTNGDSIDLKKAGYDRRTIQSTAAIAEGHVFLGSRDDGFYALDFATGERKWRTSHGGSWVVGSPAAANGRAYVGSSDAHIIEAVEIATGKQLWRARTTWNVLSSPVIAGDLLIAGTAGTNVGRGELIALETASGAIRWRLPFDEAVWSTPVIVGNEVFVGSDDGGMYAIHETNPSLVKRAVFYDSTATGPSYIGGARLAFEYFRGLGYQMLGTDSLASFFSARITDGLPSVVVFATDFLPRSVAPVPADTVLIRRYLNAGGKVVWLGEPIGAFVRDSIGRLAAADYERPGKLNGVSTSTLDFDQQAAYPTAAGQRWGITRWMRGDFAIVPSNDIVALALDERGKASCWVKVYRPDRPWAGFVQMWGIGSTPDRLPIVRAVAEYGLLRK